MLLLLLANSDSFQRSMLPWFPSLLLDRSRTVGSYVVSDGSEGRPLIGSAAGLMRLKQLVMLDRSLELMSAGNIEQIGPSLRIILAFVRKHSESGYHAVLDFEGSLFGLVYLFNDIQELLVCNLEFEAI